MDSIYCYGALLNDSVAAVDVNIESRWYIDLIEQLVARSVVDSSAAISGLGCRGAVISSLARKRN